MRQTDPKRFISIKARLFLQVGAVILIAIIAILSMNNLLLPQIYTRNEKKLMRDVCAEIDKLNISDAAFSQTVASYEKQNGFSIDIYLEDGTPVYSGSTEIFETGGKVTVDKREDFSDGSFFEIQSISKSNAQYIVYGKVLSFGGDIEMFSRKSTVDSNANTAILITSTTSAAALLAALVFMYFYSLKFTKPLISMSRITEKMSDMDFSEKCETKTNDELGQLSNSINNLSDSLCETLDDLQEKNEKLRLDIEHEKELERIRKDFISNVSHELKTPISIIRGYSEGAELLLESEDIESAKSYCNIIVNETDKMNALVLQLLELSMYESGSITLKTDRFNIYDMIDDYKNDNDIRFSENGITFINKVSDDIFGTADIIKIGMVLNNYISNAVSHCDGEKKICVSAKSADDAYRIEVYNTGKNIDDEDIDRIWQSFYRADKAHSRNEGRFGLGLSIVSAIQNLHGEQFGVYNISDGVCFWFDIKKAETD